jgi:hypothetical protein
VRISECGEERLSIREPELDGQRLVPETQKVGKGLLEIHSDFFSLSRWERVGVRAYAMSLFFVKLSWATQTNLIKILRPKLRTLIPALLPKGEGRSQAVCFSYVET